MKFATIKPDDSPLSQRHADPHHRRLAREHHALLIAHYDQVNRLSLPLRKAAAPISIRSSSNRRRAARRSGHPREF